MDLEQLRKAPWWMKYLLSLKKILKSDEATDEVFQKRKHWITVTENLLLKLKDVSECLQNQPCDTFIKSEQKVIILQENEELLELFFLIEQAQVEEVPEKKLEDWILVFSLIETFKLTLLILDKYFYTQEDTELVKLCTEFLLYTFKVLKVFTVPNPQRVSSKYLYEKGKKAVSLLALTIIAVPKNRAISIVLKILPCVLENIVQNSLIMVFLNYLLSHHRCSLMVSVAVLKYFNDIEFMKTLNHKEEEEVDLFLAILGNSLKSMSLFSDDVSLYQKLCLENIVKTCILLIPTVDKPRVQFLVLHFLFEALHIHKLFPVKAYLQKSLATMFSAFKLWLLTPVESKTWLTFLETIIMIASSFLSDDCRHMMLPFTQTIVRTVIYSLKENADLATEALILFEKMMVCVSFQYINNQILPLKHDFLNALYEALKSPVDSVSQRSFSILGKMGGYNRDVTFRDTSELKVTPNEDNLSFTLLNNTEQCLTLTLGKIFDVAYKQLKLKDANIIKQQSLPVLKVLCSSFDSNAINGMQSSTFRFLNDPDSKSQIWDIYPGNPEFCHICKNALIGLFVALEVPDCFDNVKPIIEKVTKNFVKKYTFGDLDIRLLIDAALEAMCFPKSSPDEIRTDGLEIIMNIAFKKSECADMQNSIFFGHLVKQVINLCGQSTWEERIAGCKGIRYFMKEFPEDWMLENVNIFLNTLIYSLADIEGKISFGSGRILKCTIEELLHKYFARKLTFETVEELEVHKVKEESGCETGSESTSEGIGIFSKDETDLQLLEKLQSVPDMENVECPDYVSQRNKVAKATLLMLIEGAISENYFVREQFRIAMELFFLNCEITIDNLPNILFKHARFLVYFHEDFDFCVKSRGPIFKNCTFEQYEDLYKSLKAMWDFDVIQKLTSHSARPSAVRRCCGTLNALLFNFYKPSSNELLRIFFMALQNPIKDISDVGRKCLQHVDILLNENQSCVSLADELMVHFRIWKQRLQSPNSLNVVFGSQIISLLTTTNISKELYIDEIFSFLFDSPHLNFAKPQFLENSLKDPLIKFCKKFPQKAIKKIVQKMYDINLSELLEELLQSEDFAVCLVGRDVINLMNSKYDKFCHILPHMAKYENWFASRTVLADYLLFKLNLESDTLNWEEMRNIHALPYLST